jgi:hypothetical protein
MLGSDSARRMPPGAVRRPLTSSSVDSGPNPRRLMAEMRVAFAAASWAPPVRDSSGPRFSTTGRVRAIWERFDTPAASISSRLTSTTGWPTALTPRMLEPVTTTSSRSSSVFGVAAEAPALSARHAPRIAHERS